MCLLFPYPNHMSNTARLGCCWACGEGRSYPSHRIQTSFTKQQSSQRRGISKVSVAQIGQVALDHPWPQTIYKTQHVYKKLHETQPIFLCLSDGAFTNISLAYGSIPCNVILLWIKTGLKLHALSLECGAGLKRANMRMILMAPVWKSACGGASEIAPIAKEKHMTQAMWCILFLVSLQAGRNDLGSQDQLSNRLPQNVHFCPNPLLSWSFWEGMRDHDILVAKCVTQKPGLAPLLWLPRPAWLLICQFQTLTKLKPIGEKSQAENLKPWVKRRSTNMMKRQICTSICQKRILTNRWKQWTTKKEFSEIKHTQWI
jgi:hypothetical protein